MHADSLLCYVLEHLEWRNAMAHNAQSSRPRHALDPAQIRAKHLTAIRNCCEDYLVGSFFLRYAIKPRFNDYFLSLDGFSDEELRKELTRADFTIGVLQMGLIVEGGFLDPKTMSKKALTEYRQYCRDICKFLRTVDFDHPPELLKVYT